MIGIDYSLTSPAMCISPTGEWADSKFWFLTDKKKYKGSFLGGKITGSLHQEWKTPEERYDKISGYFIHIIAKIAPNDDVVIEGFSMGSKGLVFNIAESTGILKHKIYLRGHNMTLVPPTVLKRHAALKGNADKILMYQSFLNKTGEDLSIFGKPGTNPSSDIIDAFYLTNFAFTIKDNRTTM